MTWAVSSNCEKSKSMRGKPRKTWKIVELLVKESWFQTKMESVA
jgi:hypothetical protein